MLDKMLPQTMRSTYIKQFNISCSFQFMERLYISVNDQPFCCFDFGVVKLYRHHPVNPLKEYGLELLYMITAVR